MTKVFGELPSHTLDLESAIGPIEKMEHRILIDINSGTFDQLKTLAGIGETYAKRIVDKRPYQCADELVMKHVIPQRSYDRIKEHIMTRPK